MSTSGKISPESPVLSGFLIERTSKRMKHACQQMLKAANAGITVDQWVILSELEQSEGAEQKEIARKTFKDAPTLTRIIDILCKKGLTERRMATDDRRKFNIHLTPSGKQKIRKVAPMIDAFRKQAYQDFSKEEIDQLRQLMNRIFHNLTTLE
jgi:DNA-binding MarR family transcriptional regulator